MPRIVDKNAKRRSLIQAAAAVFAREGFARTKMAHIAAEAGVGKGTLYEYFASKDELFLAMCRDLVEWPEDISRFTEEPRQGLHDLILALVDSYERASGFFSILIDYWSVIIREKNEHGQLFLSRGADLYDQPRGLIASVIVVGQARGAFRQDLDATRTAQVIIAGIEGLRIQRALDPVHLDLNETVSCLADVMLARLAASAA
ncbi:hypothetical protein DF286_11940 [Sphingosinicella humi]|uniref:HTH tetR-type domain-containing protein n=2 Tax=Allosphingosinicella humi TaxID=2068657 RepID=A0A2U2J5C4_9SPHN|nr:hypothetical protein DF286_11940 [Sphingosinicella humi]